MSTTLIDLDPGRIEANPANPRQHVGNVDELADSIRSLGILEPLIVAPSDLDLGIYVLIAGHRRLTAARQAGLTTVPAHYAPSPAVSEDDAA